MRDKPSVYEVAQYAGVSTATVSRVLTGHERVLPVTERRESRRRVTGYTKWPRSDMFGQSRIRRS